LCQPVASLTRKNQSNLVRVARPTQWPYVYNFRSLGALEWNEAKYAIVHDIVDGPEPFMKTLLGESLDNSYCTPEEKM
jgi:hypothetical protein